MFADEIRKMDFELSGASAPPEMIDLMEKLVKKLTHRKFDVLDVKNPQLQCKWMKLEEEALEEKADDEEFMDLSGEYVSLTFSKYSVSVAGQ
jgi:hypothetical protein